MQCSGKTRGRPSLLFVVRHFPPTGGVSDLLDHPALTHSDAGRLSGVKHPPLGCTAGAQPRWCMGSNPRSKFGPKCHDPEPLRRED